MLFQRLLWAGSLDYSLRRSQYVLNQTPPTCLKVLQDAILRSIIALNLGHAYRLRGDVKVAMAAFHESMTQGRFTESAQDAPVIHAGEEWAFLIRGLGGRVKPVFVHHFSLLDMSVTI